VIGVIVFVGLGSSQGYDIVLESGGFYMAANLAIATWAGLGSNATLGLLSRTPYSRGRRAPRQREARRGKNQSAFAVSTGGVLALLVWSLAAHITPALHQGPSFVEDYAANVFDELPSRSVLIVWGAERYFPLGYRQIVFEERTDVDVVVINQLNRPWYREQSERALGVDIPMPKETDSRKIGAALARRLQSYRPVYLDVAASVELSRHLESSLEGLVARVEGGPTTPASPDELVQALNSYRKTGLYSHPARLRFPNYQLLLPYVHLHMEAGIGFAQREDLAKAREEFAKAVAIAPNNAVVRHNLAELERAFTGSGSGRPR
jgi:hypothetical protein